MKARGTERHIVDGWVTLRLQEEGAIDDRWMTA